MALKIEFLTCDQASFFQVRNENSQKRKGFELRKMKQSWGVFVCLVERSEVRRLSLLSSETPLVNIRDYIRWPAIALLNSLL